MTASAGAAFAIVPFACARAAERNLSGAGTLNPVALQVESATDPIVVENRSPRLTWQLVSTVRGAVASAFRVRVSSSPALLASGMGDLWDSGKVRWAGSSAVPYGGRPLTSRQPCFWQVQVWDAGDVPSPWSPVATWEMGLLEPADWRAAWIGRADNPDDSSAPLLRKTFPVSRAVRHARLYVAAAGYYEAYLNDQRVGGHVLDPAPTDADKRVLYVVHDVTHLLREGDNAIGLVLGRGFFDVATETAWAWTRAPWRASPRARAQLEIRYADGSDMVLSDGSWRMADSPTRFDSVYAGETYDAVAHQPDWASPSFDDTRWSPACVVDPPRGRLVAQVMEPVRIVGTVPAVAVRAIAPRTHIFDFGQTVAGWAELRASAPRGTRITLAYAQQLKPDGTVDLEQSYVKGGRFQRDDYVFAGDGEEIWQPRFSHKSFRYVQVTGLDGELPAATLTGKEVRSDLTPTAGFQCSDDTYNRIHAMAARSLGHHLLGVPAVDVMYEKIGWTADAQLNVPSMAIQFDSHRFLEKWLDDIADSQTGEGNIPVIVPSGGWGYAAQSTEWKAAFPIVMWEIYRRFGDERVLSRHYPGVRRYVAWELSRLDASGLATTDLGDWLAPGGYTQPPEDTRLSATAYLCRSLELLAKAAAVLGLHDDAARYRGQQAGLAQRFNAAFLDSHAGYYRTTKDPGYRQCSNALPLAFGLVPAATKASVAASLVADIRARGNHLNTGALGTAVLLPVLVETGYGEVAHAVATQSTFPGWGFWLANGADTLWETWELKQEGQGRPPSHDHYLFGSINAWFFEQVAGITPIAPGYAAIRVEPLREGSPDTLRAWMTTPRGRVALRWARHAGGAWDMTLEVPPGMTADVHLPVPEGRQLFESGRPARTAAGMHLAPDGRLRLTGGRFEFACPAAAHAVADSHKRRNLLPLL